ncbi:cation:proton antiporter [Candidatus Nitrospira nitrificans]|uniref:cation:proton antiporter n=1 Tax=Candidatus Nitrospira nitrificans TaxID=1742973 RepID=UPI0015857EDD|nr:cation:proton antiporter [Candidatus Nitrospira nitrificans]
MHPDSVFFQDLAIVFLAAVAGGILARIAGQPLILGYVLGGIAIGPFTPGPTISESHTFDLFAEIGVILLMFSIGLEFSVKDLMRVKWVALAGGPLGILVAIGLAVMTGSLIGWSTTQSIVIGAVISIASTMVLARLLVDRGEIRSKHGRVMIGIALVEDVAVVAMTVLMPALGEFDSGRVLLIGQAFVKALLILLPLGYLGAKVIPLIMTHVARTQNQELFLLVTLAISLGTAAVTQMVGLSLALGAFLAGLLISASEYGHETLARLLSLRDAFVALFFVTIGILIDPRVIIDNLSLLATMIGLIVVGMFMIWTTIVRLFGYSWTTAFLVGIGLTQIGEFSFVLVQVAKGAGHIGSEVYNATLAASVITILINAALVRYVPDWLARRRLAHDQHDMTPWHPESEPLQQHVVLCGFGRVGSSLGRALDAFSLPYVVIDRNPDIIRRLQGRHIACIFGDASHRELLMKAGAADASLMIVALPEIEPAALTVSRIRAINPKVPILARAHGPAEAERLSAGGAAEVIQPEVETAATLIRHVLAWFGVPKDRILNYVEHYRQVMETKRQPS